jgi:hypothetical protein
MSTDLHDHLTWLGYLQPDGLVVSPAALVDTGLLFDRNTRPLHQDFLDHLRDEQAWDEAADPTLRDLPAFLQKFLRWPAEAFVATDDQPLTLSIVLPEYQETLRATWAIRNLHGTEPAFRLLVHELPPGQDFDAPVSEHARGWHASPARRFERLLRETRVGLGLLCNGDALRLLYAPPGENPGSLTFKLSEMAQIAGRPILGGFHLLFEEYRLFTAPEKETLTALLKRSRDFQANVSTALSHQVLEALFELARGFQAADDRSHGDLLAETWLRDPQQIYGGLISTLLRLVFLLYAEDRGLMPSGELYLQNYSVQGLYDQLRADAERYPDTMDQRFGAWARLLALFRVTHRGSKHPEMKLPARQGHLFDPARFPFLEGRGRGTGNRDQESGDRSQESGRENEPPQQSGPASSSNQKSKIQNQQSSISSSYRNTDLRNTETPSSLPLLSDGTLHRILDLLLYLSGERLSYRTLDVEQIGSVYETIMGFEVQKATGRSVALKPKKSHGAPVHLDLDALLAAKPADREKTLLEQADTKLPDAAAKALKSAATLDDLLAALDKRIDRRATPHPVPAGSIILQPTDERRRSGSHYTARSFTNPIVRKTLEPILDRLGRHPLPAAILDLKICDIAIGSGAFQVEVCRQLADELVSSWHFHKCLPVIPPDEDELLFARRLVAQRCLYGVDRNPMAVDLAKLSLWLATMAKDHPFTFLDHAIKCGDSLVGLTNQQIAAFHWDPTQAKDRVFGQEKLEQQIAKVAAARKSILDWTEDTEAAVLKKRDFLAAADSAAASLKTTGDLAIAAFLAGEKPKQRQQNRDEFLHRHLELQKGDAQQIPWEVNTLKQLRGGEFPIRPFHWEIEFPEVFSRENPGFDAIVGNPPFLGGRGITERLGENYAALIRLPHENATGGADMVALFFRRAFEVLREDGTFGLIATNTIGQGDTRSTGLSWICTHGGTIYTAEKRYRWPGQAAVVVSIVWVIKGTASISCKLDGKIAPVITAYLFHAGGHDNPSKLSENIGKSYQGSITLGMGFTFDDNDSKGVATPLAEMHNLFAKNPRNKERVFPYIGGEEINGSPTHAYHRYVIDFGEMTLEQAGHWPDLLEIVETKVKPARAEKSAEVAKWPWWQFWRPRAELYRSIEPFDRVLVTNAQASPHHAITFYMPRVIFANSINIFTLGTWQAFAVMQSYTHELWARFFSSSMKDDLRYNPTDCFETFPFPTDWESNSALETAGREYYEYRAALMVRNDEGLTKTYNRFHDPEERSPDIHQLRTLHAAMDRAVLAAYGWPDIPTACEFLLDYEEDEDSEDAPEASGKKKRAKKKPYRYRWPDEVRDEVLARLLALNAERAEQERLSGAGKGAGKKTAKKVARQKPADDSQTEMF